MQAEEALGRVDKHHVFVAMARRSGSRNREVSHQMRRAAAMPPDVERARDDAVLSPWRQIQSDPGGGHPVRVVGGSLEVWETEISVPTLSVTEGVADELFRPISSIISIVSLAVLSR
jgi:hypothetical protein